jgi:hypothetical protein
MRSGCEEAPATGSRRTIAFATTGPPRLPARRECRHVLTRPRTVACSLLLWGRPRKSLRRIVSLAAKDPHSGLLLMNQQRFQCRLERRDESCCTSAVRAASGQPPRALPRSSVPSPHDWFGDNSITPVVASWHEPRDCFRVGRGTGRAIATPRTQPSCRMRADACVTGMIHKSNRSRLTSDAARLLLEGIWLRGQRLDVVPGTPS